MGAKYSKMTFYQKKQLFRSYQENNYQPKKIPRGFHKISSLKIGLPKNYASYALQLEFRDNGFDFSRLGSTASDMMNFCEKVRKELTRHQWKTQSKLKLVLQIHFQPSKKFWRVFGLFINKGFPNLRELKLDIRSSNSLTDHDLERLSYHFRQDWKNLRTLKISLYRMPDKFTYQGFQLLGNGISHNSANLTSLTLLIDIQNLDDQMMDTFFQQIYRYSNKLKSLGIVVEQCRRLTDKTCRIIGSKTLRHLSRLRQFNLDFDRFQGMTNEGLASLGKGVARHLVNLEQLALCFHLCKKVTGQCVEEIVSEIVHRLIKLERLTLLFPLCRNITEESVERVGFGIAEHSVNLNQLCLNFSDCGKVTDETVMAIGFKIAEHLTKLQNLTFYFCYGSEHVSQRSTKKLKEKLDYVQKVDIC